MQCSSSFTQTFLWMLHLSPLFPGPTCRENSLTVLFLSVMATAINDKDWERWMTGKLLTLFTTTQRFSKSFPPRTDWSLDLGTLFHILSTSQSALNSSSKSWKLVYYGNKMATSSANRSDPIGHAIGYLPHAGSSKKFYPCKVSHWMHFRQYFFYFDKEITLLDQNLH